MFVQWGSMAKTLKLPWYFSLETRKIHLVTLLLKLNKAKLNPPSRHLHVQS